MSLKGKCASLRGRPIGLNGRQQRVWTENQKKIVYALMDVFPNSVGISFLQKRTGLSRPTLYKHIEKLEKEAVLVRESGNLRLDPAYHAERHVRLQDAISHQIPLEEGILVVRLESNNPVTCQISSGSTSLYTVTSPTVASTIPFTTQPTVQIAPTQQQTTINVQVMAFKLDRPAT
ncbi:MAG: winged helix-turn-helix domain-containing protein [archaeon YNP-WB-062]|nr:winged helix-turn-helix domain-containing protein [Candidatus Culexarchaeum yellowstonense]